ncbi:FAD:protein FMN transferase [Tunicatimonas pelagia]|uniref:FAD:protein FMN transferase n=1 Tax=Tunicatimonas pelagia TaxID=931531 RepID=UPI00266651A0|nr:FAD:protein FMN transferase [Tunicatimonas pelagia]WKN45186.1 FAD:protein FMN transferase [Tunicatimonas pelagia]
MNPNQKKNIIYSIVLLASVAIVWWVRNQPEAASQEATYLNVLGQTMGTTYNIKYQDDQRRSFKPAIDSLLTVFNQSVNHYLPDSEITRFNQQDTLYFDLPYFYPVLKRSDEIVQATDSAFDPTVAPLVNAWGFGPEDQQLPDSATVDSLLQLVGFDKIMYTPEYVTKKITGASLNFSAIAKGAGVDVVGEYLNQQGVNNFMVEIGGEVLCQGVNDKGEPWKIGIDDPNRAGNMSAAVTLNNQAIATSGNYRNYYEVDGKRYAHTIDPKTGQQVTHSVLSVSVIADDCMTADGYATAFMVLGLEPAQKIIARDPSLEVLIIYDDNGTTKTFQTDGLKDMVVNS